MANRLKWLTSNRANAAAIGRVALVYSLLALSIIYLINSWPLEAVRAVYERY